MSRLCTACGGKGHEWECCDILRRSDKAVIATTYKHGPDCPICHGTGQIHLLSDFAKVILFLVAFFATLTAIMAL